MTKRLAVRAALIFILGFLVMMISAATVTLLMRPDMLRTSSSSRVGESVLIGGPFELVDTAGATVTEALFEGQPYAIFFGFTFCPDVCPTTMAEMAGWIEQLGADAAGMKFAFVSVDPERDTPEVLKDYIGVFSDQIIGLTGTMEQIDAVTKSYRVFARRVELDNGDYTMDHSASVLLFDKNGDLQSMITFQASEDEAMAKLRGLING